MTDYPERYVAFIDILGFSEHVKSIGEKPEKLDRLLEALHEMAAEYPGLARNMSATQGFENMFRATTFSDNIVISSRPDHMGLSVLITVIGQLCLRLLHQGFYARGGISKGLLHHSDQVVLGAGLIKSYELESKAAVYPRIIYDEPIVNEVKASDIANVWPVTMDQDGVFFLDYLGTTWLTNLCKQGSFNLVREDIMATLGGNKPLNVKSKAGWLARYMNARIDASLMEQIPLAK